MVLEGVSEISAAAGGGASDESRLTVLALNSGSSSLKFGLYSVGPSGTDTLLSGEADSIGGGSGKFNAKDARQRELVSETASIPSQRDAVVRIGRLLADFKMPSPDGYESPGRFNI